jgi:hypothetical protein
LRASSPEFFAAMIDNMTRAYNKATDAAVIAELTAGGTQATGVAADSAGIISYVSTQAPAAYLATGELATKLHRWYITVVTTIRRNRYNWSPNL